MIATAAQARALAWCAAVAVLVAGTARLATRNDLPTLHRSSVGAHAGSQTVASRSITWPHGFVVAEEGELTDVYFLAEGRAYSAIARSDGFSIVRNWVPSSSIEVTLVGAAHNRTAVVDDPRPTLLTFFSGHTGERPPDRVRFARSVRFEDVYPGIDALYHLSGGSLEIDFVVEPGVDPGAIRMAAPAGARFKAEVRTGDILVESDQSRFRLKAPLAYQMIDGRRVEVKVVARIHANLLSFDLAPFDETKELIIDPLVARYSTLVGADTDAFNDVIRSLAVDQEGNLYLAGITQFDFQYPIERGFPTTDASLNPPNPRADSPGENCAWQCGFVLKLNRDRQVVFGALIYGLDIMAIAVDGDGQVHATGHTLTGDEFPGTEGAFSLDPAGQAFAFKLNAAGSDFLYNAQFAGTEGRDIAIDTDGSAIVVGMVDVPNLPTTPGTVKPQYQDLGETINEDGFLLKIDPTGSFLRYGTYLGGAGSDDASSITVSDEGTLIIGGLVSSDDFPGLPAAKTSKNGDGYVLEMQRDASSVLRARVLGGSDFDYASTVSTDGQGGVLVAGTTFSTNFPTTPSAMQTTLLGQRNGWVARLDVNFEPVYSTYFGGSLVDGVTGIAGDGAGNAYLVGYSYSADIPTTDDAFQDTTAGVISDLLAGAGDAFLVFSSDLTREAYFALLSPDGARVEYGTYLGGYYTVPRDYPPLTLGTSIFAENGVVYVAGRTDTENFPQTGDGLNDGMRGGADSFLVEFRADDLVVTSRNLLPSATIDTPYFVQLKASGGIPPYRWQIVGSTLPDGLTMNDVGRIEGQATNPQSENWGHQFTVRVTDASGNYAHKSMFINVHWPGNPRCDDSVCTMSLLVSQAFNFPLPFLARGVAPFYLEVNGELPPGSSVDYDTGTIGGTPTSAGHFVSALTMSDSALNSATLTWDITVSDGSTPPPEPPPPPPPPPPPNAGGSSGGGGTTDWPFVILVLALNLARRKQRPPFATKGFRRRRAP